MAENRYMVLEGNTIMARDMTLETALMLVCGIAEMYWRETDLEIIIRREPICEGCEDVRNQRDSRADRKE